MSFILMAKAMQIKVGNSARKLVLLKLADNANDAGECVPSYQHIADQCEMSRRSVINHVQALIDMGLLVKFERLGGEKRNRSNRPGSHTLSAGVAFALVELPGCQSHVENVMALQAALRRGLSRGGGGRSFPAVCDPLLTALLPNWYRSAVFVGWPPAELS